MINQATQRWVSDRALNLRTCVDAFSSVVCFIIFLMPFFIPTFFYGTQNTHYFMQVTLPTFILEKRSLLEMFADFLGHTDIFLSIPDGSTPEERMFRVLKFYLSSFHCGRQSK